MPDARDSGTTREDGSVMGLIERTTWRCPDCGWAHSYDEPMTDVYCVDCFRQGRGKDHRCERMVPAADHRGAVDALQRLKTLADELDAAGSTYTAALMRERIEGQ